MSDESTTPSDPPEAPVTWLFGPFQLAPSRGRLSSGGAERPLARKSFEMLVHLIRHRDRVVPRAEILAVVWQGVTVSEAAVTSALRDLRRCLGDTGEQSRFIATIRGRGLRFVHDVREVVDAPDDIGGIPWAGAAVHFERALEALELVETSRGRPAAPSGSAQVPRQRGELMVALARARWSGGATEGARQAFLEAAAVARQSGEPEILAQAALGFAGRSDVTPGVNREAVRLLEESLEALPAGDSAIRAELLSRLGTELYYDDDLERSDRLTSDGLAMAECVGDASVTAYAATARHFSCQRPDIEPEQRILLADRAIALSTDLPSSDTLALALQERLVDLFELGYGEDFDETFGHYERVVLELGQPFFAWLLSMFRGTRALAAGQVEEAEQLAHATLAIGKQVQTPNADGVFAAQIFAVRREQGRLAELATALDAIARTQPALPIFRAGRAAVAAATSPAAANAAIEAVMANDLDDFPRDQNWISTLGTLAPVAIAARNELRIRQLLERLEPYARRMIVVGQGAATHGAVSHHLGLLHGSLGAMDEAARWLDDAVEVHRRAHAPAWVAHTERARAVLR